MMYGYYSPALVIHGYYSFVRRRRRRRRLRRGRRPSPAGVNDNDYDDDDLNGDESKRYSRDVLIENDKFAPIGLAVLMAIICKILIFKRHDTMHKDTTVNCIIHFSMI
jgi:hypothetical protein